MCSLYLLGSHTHRIIYSSFFFQSSPMLRHYLLVLRQKRLRAYRVPELLKPEVDRQISEMLDLGIITPSSGLHWTIPSSYKTLIVQTPHSYLIQSSCSLTEN